MPRLICKTFKLARNEDHLYKAAEAAEAGSLAFIIATDRFNTGADLITRCGIAAVAWFMYSDYVDALP